VQVWFERWMAKIPLPLTAADRDGGFWWELSMRQVETSRPLVFDDGVHARAFFEALLCENMDLGRPENVELLLRRGQRLGRPTLPPARGGFKTKIDRYCDLVTINVFYKNSRLKQYLKDGVALRIETATATPSPGLLFACFYTRVGLRPRPPAADGTRPAQRPTRAHDSAGHPRPAHRRLHRQGPRPHRRSAPASTSRLSVAGVSNSASSPRRR
jgi:hypothetical protein